MRTVDLKKLVRLSSTSGYNATNKKEFARLSRNLLRELDDILQKDVYSPFQDAASIYYNAGGIAVSGEATLHNDSIYVQISGTDLGILYRTCQDRRDYSGGPNHWFPWGRLIERGIAGLAEVIYIVAGIQSDGRAVR